MGPGDSSHASRLDSALVASLSLASWQPDPERVGDTALGDALLEMSALAAALEAQRIAYLAEFDRRRLATQDGARDTAHWLAGRTLLEVGAAKALVSAGCSVRDEPDVADALAQSQIAPAHARLICRFFEKPPSAMTRLAETDEKAYEAVRAACRDALLAAAAPSGDTTTASVRAAVEKLEHRLDCEGGDVPTKERSELNELHVSTTLHGRVVIRGDLDAVSGEVVRTALSKLSAPRPAEDGTRDPREAPLRRADAFVRVCESFLARGDAGIEAGERPHVTVVMNEADLRERESLGDRVRDSMAALRDGIDLPWTHFGASLSPATARALTCDAHITAVRAKANGVPLSMGRTQRLVTAAQRRALTVRDKGCAFPGCTAPAPWCEAHHVIHWANGGPTDLENLVLICGHHHRFIHHGDWTVTTAPGAPPTFERKRHRRARHGRSTRSPRLRGGCVP
ncbi:HNH endonuclease [Rhodococcus rhodnii]|uniref:HNH nuclease domain-containing protein n=2 Tax=Rhodococcus rhodnii TaxID=38312 RepID=R7WML9_9NOCA|nr:HNH endonuclease signature motif containing protein [Rhodococcus rhodnii]EOM76530.1 hypothetical protein Rrhod_2070 [Rhodococcus rhodnii LMG 5362]TXG92149.1 HNH endonuclease [Rhodococcus rhodnii]